MAEVDHRIEAVGDLHDSGDIPEPRAGSACAILEESLVMFGGLGMSDFFNDVHSLDLGSGVWTQWNCGGVVPTPRGSAAHGVALGGSLVICGGRTALGVTRDVFLLDPRTRRWSHLEPVAGQQPEGREDAAGLVIEGQSKLLIYGGSSEDGSALGDLWIFDLYRSTWLAIDHHGDPPVHGLAAASAVMIPGRADGDYAIVHGGYDGSAYKGDTYLLDLQAFYWTKLEVDVIPRPRTHCVIHSRPNGDVLIFGGYSGAVALDDLWLLNFRKKVDRYGMVHLESSWEHVELPQSTSKFVTARGAPGFAFNLQKNALYVFGGCNGSQFLSSVSVFCFKTEDDRSSTSAARQHHNNISHWQPESIVKSSPHPPSSADSRHPLDTGNDSRIMHLVQTPGVDGGRNHGSPTPSSNGGDFRSPRGDTTAIYTHDVRMRAVTREELGNASGPPMRKQVVLRQQERTGYPATATSHDDVDDLEDAVQRLRASLHTEPHPRAASKPTDAANRNQSANPEHPYNVDERRPNVSTTEVSARSASRLRSQGGSSSPHHEHQGNSLPTSPTSKERRIELLEDENERLRNENAMLRRELELLRQQSSESSPRKRQKTPVRSRTWI